MKTMQIFEPAMCCSTGLCGVSVDPELLRISTVLDTLKKSGVTVDRFNLNNAPMEFVTNQAVNDFINSNGPEGLPVTLLDGIIVLTGRYPTNGEFAEWLDLPTDLLALSGGTTVEKAAESSESLTQEDAESGDCCCKGGCC